MNKRHSLVFVLIFVIASGLVSVKSSYSSASKVEVGLFYYVWYEGGLGNGHWNSSLGWTVVDTPILGFYDSSDPSVIKQHLKWFGELGVDFLIISWWGSGALQGYQFADTATRVVFDLINETNSPIKITLMVEDFNQSGMYDFTAVYDYIYDNYATQYGNEFFELNGKPLVCWWNSDVTNTSESRGKIWNDSRFTARIIGHNAYVDWYAWRPCSVDDEDYPITLPKMSKDGFTCIEPRYDDSYIGRNNTFDGDYSEGLYDRQWTWALKQGGNLSIIAIYSWNEYHERSEIEPHITNGTSVLLPFTKTYQYNTLSSLYQQYSCDYQALQENYTSLQDSYSNLQASFDTLNGSFTSLDSGYDTLSSSYTSLQAAYDNLVHNFDALNSNLTNLQRMYDNSQTNYTLLKSNLTDLQEHYDNLEHEYETLQLNFTSLLSDYSALVVQQNDLKTTVQNALNETVNTLYVLIGVIVVLIIAVIILVATKSRTPSPRPKETQITS
jgi:acyl carrier protein phosphodiesterase